MSTLAAVQSVRNNTSITLDMALVKENSGLLYDIPLLTLGDGKVNVEQDSAIMIPLENMAARSEEYGYTFLMNIFPYLPDLAE